MKQCKKAGLFGTIETRINNESIPSLRTTLEAPQLQKLLHKMVKRNIEMCAMEVSSQAISQQRINGCKFELVIFTNLSHDHLDYHKTITNYFNEKAKLFNKKFTKKALISIDDKWGQKLVKQIKGIEVQTFSAGGVAGGNATEKNADWKFIETKNGFKINNIESKTKLFGKFNKINAALAIVSAKICGIKNSEKTIKKVRNIPGRSEIVYKHPKIIIDYAHTPEAIKELLTELKQVTKGNLITVAGAGVERDNIKRPQMSNLIFSLSDYYVITDDNFRSENPNTIRNELQKAIPKSSKVFNIKGRANGIKKALKLISSKNDTIAILGKGHENYIITNKGYEPYNDKETVTNLFQKIVKL